MYRVGSWTPGSLCWCNKKQALRFRAALMGTHRGHKSKTPGRKQQVGARGSIWKYQDICSQSKAISANIYIYKSYAKGYGWDIKGQRVWHKPLLSALARHRALGSSRQYSLKEEEGPAPGDFQLCWLLIQPQILCRNRVGSKLPWFWSSCMLCGCCWHYFTSQVTRRFLRPSGCLSLQQGSNRPSHFSWLQNPPPSFFFLPFCLSTSF